MIHYSKMPVDAAKQLPTGIFFVPNVIGWKGKLSTGAEKSKHSLLCIN